MVQQPFTWQQLQAICPLWKQFLRLEVIVVIIVTITALTVINIIINFTAGNSYNRVSWRRHNVETEQLSFSNYDRSSSWKRRCAQVCWCHPSKCHVCYSTFQYPAGKSGPSWSLLHIFLPKIGLILENNLGACWQKGVVLTVCWHPQGGPLLWWPLLQVFVIVISNVIVDAVNGSHDSRDVFQVRGQQLKSYWTLVPTLIGEQFGFQINHSYQGLKIMMLEELMMLLHGPIT